MDGYILSAEEQAKVINRAYNRTRVYVQSEIEKILHHVGGEDSLAYEYRMKRLAALLKNTEQKMKELYGINVEDTTKFLRSIIPEAYYHTIFDIAQGTGEEPMFSAVNTKLIDSIVKEPWSGQNYSKRIWNNTNKLADEVREVLTEAAQSGESISKTSKKLADAFNTSQYNAERLIRTETTYACNQAEIAGYKELDIDKYRFVATLDTRTSPICQMLDGKVFPTDKAQAGKNLPSMHPNCRSTTIPEFEEGMPEFRTARDKDGNRITVPADMTYPEWYDKYVKPKEEQNTPKTPSKSPKGKDTSPKPEAAKTPQKPPEKPPADVEIPAPKQEAPEYTETPIPKRPTEVPRPVPTAPSVETPPKTKKTPTNSGKDIDKTDKNAIIDVDRKASAPNMKPPDFDKYEVKEDKTAVQKAKGFIINVLGVAADKVKLDGIKNADVLNTFLNRLHNLCNNTGMKIPAIIARDIIDGDETCIADFKPFEQVLYISTRYFNSKEALIAALNDWRDKGATPLQMKNVVFIAEHEGAHILIPDRIIETQEALRIWKNRNLSDKMSRDIYDYYANAVAIYRMNPQIKDSNIIEAVNYLREQLGKEGLTL